MQRYFCRLADRQPADKNGKVVIPCDSLPVPSDLLANTLHLQCTAWNARRLLPHAPVEDGAFQYHHDCRPRQVKAMLLLTDVGIEDQRMDYIPGTHRARWPQAPYAATRFTDATALSYGLPVYCTGEAGTLFIFASNGLHRGNRSMGAVRDTITLHFEPRWWR